MSASSKPASKTIDAAVKAAEAAAAGARKQDAALRSEIEKLVASGDSAGAIDTLLGVIGALRSDNMRMGVRVANMARLLFGRRSERLSKEDLQQLMLAFGATEEEAAQEAPNIPVAPADDALTDDGDAAADEETPEAEKDPKKSNHPGRGRLSDKLKRQLVQTLVPADERACGQCGSEMGAIGGQEHERIEYVPAQIIVHVERREKIGCKGCRGDAVTAERAEPRPIVGRADVSVLAHLVQSKCEDALPIHRQAEQFKRLGCVGEHAC